MNRAFIGLLALTGLTPGMAAVRPDPPSGVIDPPPAEQDYIAAFPSRSWVFGKLLWQGREPCTKDYCEAAYNANPLFSLVQKEKACCGGEGYSLTIVGRIKSCSNVGYYLAWSKDLDKKGKLGGVEFLSRRVVQIASAIGSSCHRPSSDVIPTRVLSKLWR